MHSLAFSSGVLKILALRLGNRFEKISVTGYSSINPKRKNLADPLAVLQRRLGRTGSLPDDTQILEAENPSSNKRIDQARHFRNRADCLQLIHEIY